MVDGDGAFLSHLPILNEAGGLIDVEGGTLTVTGGCCATDFNSIYQPASSTGAQIDFGDPLTDLGGGSVNVGS